MRAPYVAVCGPGRASPEEAADAEAVGRLLAESGAVVVTGGLGGVMEAAAAGARSAGGVVIGILPGDAHEDANPNCTVTIPTGLGEARNALVVRCADALVAIGGEFGTLSEIALARRRGLTVVGLRTWSIAREGLQTVIEASSPQDAAELAIAAARGNVS